ncbi:MAG: aquaporin family protein [Rhizobiaceae bacterium]|nr:aquaporin family protein [Rhizobiaceae bacterium]
MIKLRAALGAEALGTLLLVACVVGSGIMADRLTDDVALALLANTLATGAILVVLITLFGPVSGAHFNPAVTMVFALRGEIGRVEAALYVVAQVAGAILGAVLAHAMFELPLVQFASTQRSGPAQFLSEAVATFGLVLTILLGIQARATPVAVLVGLYITAAYWFTASTSFANPAVAIARALTDTFSGIRLIDVPAFVAAQCVGALAALMAARTFLLPARSPVSGVDP